MKPMLVAILLSFNSSYCAVIDNTLTTLYTVHRFSMRDLSWIKTVLARFIGPSKVTKVIWIGSFGLRWLDVLHMQACKGGGLVPQQFSQFRNPKASVNFLIQPKNCRSILVENWIFTELTQEMYCNLLNFLRFLERRHLYVKAARS